jgi:hypothetical protein
MTQTNRNRLLAALLVAIPLASYSYFVTQFISEKPVADENNSSIKHRYRIDQSQSIPAQVDLLINDKIVD